MDFAVFRNGEFHWVKVKTKTVEVTHADGTKGGQVVPDPAGPSMDAQLSPQDPRFDHVSPTPEQVAEVRRIVGPPVPQERRP